MKIHEYQAKALFKEYGMPVLRGETATSASEAETAAKNLGGKGPWVVKAQVHAGGRGKGGGIKLSKSIAEVKSNAETILSNKLITPQTGAEGKDVRKLLIEEGCDIGSELYLAVVLDRETSTLVVMASREGGMEIEEVAAKTPEKIIKVHVDVAMGVTGFQARTLAFGLGLDKELHKPFAKLLKNLVSVFVEKDCALAEINPLVITKDKQFVVLDAKINFDDNALYRHPEIKEMEDANEEDPRDVEAAKWNLNYIHLDGNIGCMVNGAGLAMATMDIIKLHGGEPANFLDVGGGANTEMVTEAFKIVVSDPKVEAILINIFGGILKCDILAAGIVEAVGQVSLKVPLVVRLEGTNVKEGKKILDESNLNIRTATDMATAAKLSVEAAREGS